MGLGPQENKGDWPHVEDAEPSSSTGWKWEKSGDNSNSNSDVDNHSEARKWFRRQELLNTWRELYEAEEREKRKNASDVAANMGSFNALGFLFGLTEQSMKTLYLSDDALRDIFKAKGLSTKRIDNVLNRTANIGGFAKIGGSILFFGQAGYTIYNSLTQDQPIETIILSYADLTFSGIATFGGWPGLGISALYFSGKEIIIIQTIALEKGKAEFNYDMMNNYVGGLAPAPIRPVW